MRHCMFKFLGYKWKESNHVFCICQCLACSVHVSALQPGNPLSLSLPALDRNVPSTCRTSPDTPSPFLAVYLVISWHSVHLTKACRRVWKSFLRLCWRVQDVQGISLEFLHCGGFSQGIAWVNRQQCWGVLVGIDGSSKVLSVEYLEWKWCIAFLLIADINLRSQ